MTRGQEDKETGSKRQEARGKVCRPRGMTMVRLFTRQARKREQRDELLSAYLDDQLSAGERARLEAQLATDPALRAELDTLRHTVALVRDLPPVPVPRNFILPQTVAARPRPVRKARSRRALRDGPQVKAWTAPLLTAATAVVSLVFVAILAGDLLLPGAGRQAFAPAAAPMMEAEAPQEMASESAPVVEQVQVETEELIPAATPPPLPMEVPPGVVTTVVAEAEHYDAEAPRGIETTMPAAGGGLSEEPTAPTPSPSPAAVEKAAVAPTAPAMATAVPQEEANDVEPTPSEVAQIAPLRVEEEETEAWVDEQGAPEGETVSLRSVIPWRVLEVALGLAALGLAWATVWAWRVRRQ